MPGIGAIIRLGSGGIRALKLARRLDALRADAEQKSSTAVLAWHRGAARFDRAMRLAEAALHLRLRAPGASKAECYRRYFAFIEAELKRAEEALARMQATRDQVAALAIAVKVARHDIDGQIETFHENLKSLDERLTPEISALETTLARETQRRVDETSALSIRLESVAKQVTEISTTYPTRISAVERQLLSESEARRKNEARTSEIFAQLNEGLSSNKRCLENLQAEFGTHQQAMAEEQRRVRLALLAVLTVSALLLAWVGSIAWR